MITAIESVTLGVEDLDAATRLLRTQLGLDVVAQAVASVSLLSTWKHPVHDGVRLLDLAKGAASSGRVRLAWYESGLTSRLASAPKSTGIKALDFRPFGAKEAGTIIAGPADVPLLVPGGNPESATPQTSAIWIVSNNLEAAAHFYSNVLGFTAKEAPAISDEHRQNLCRLADVPTSTKIELRAFQPPGKEGCAIVLAQFVGVDIEPPAQPIRPGQSGFNLMTLSTPQLDAIAERLESAGIEALTPPTHVGLPNGRPGRVMLVRGPDQELIELYEIQA